MKKLMMACSAGIMVFGLSACSGDQAACEEALAAFDTAASETCPENTIEADIYFNQAACDAANDDGYDNTEFYACLTEKFGGEAADVCEEDGDVKQFEDTTGDEGCRDLYNATEG